MFKDYQKIEAILLDNKNPNPFPAPPAAIDFHNNPPQFICGRTEEIDQIKEDMLNSINFKEPKLIKVFGKQGIGKSTLICWINKDLTEKEKLVKPMIFLNASGQPQDFHFINFYHQIISRLEQDQILEKLAYYSMVKFVNLLISKEGKLKESIFTETPIKLENLEKIKENSFHLRQLIIDNPSIGLDIIKLYKKFLNFIRNDIPAIPSFVVTLWNAFSFTTSGYDALNALKARGEFEGFRIHLDSEARQTLIDFIKLYQWAIGKSAITVIIDHLESCTNEKKIENFSNLFSLLLELRQLSHLCIILSGTMDAFVTLDQVLQEDQKMQLDNWSRMITLSSLQPEVVVDVVKRFLSNFWKNQIYEPPHDCDLFPFGPNSIKYLYDTTNQDLRQTLIRLHDLVESYRKNQKIEEIYSFFDAMRRFRIRKDITLTALEQKYFAEELMDPKVQDKVRSTQVELALVNLFNIAKTNYQFISDVKHEPKIGDLRPDVFIELFGNLGMDQIRKVAFEVKIYRIGEIIPPSEVKKSLNLLNEHRIDHLHWVSNKSLSSIKYDLDSNLHPYLGRTKPLDIRELAYASFAVNFKEIFQRDPTPDEAIEILKKVGIDILTISEDLKSKTPLCTIPKRIKAPTTLDHFKESKEELKEKPIEEKLPIERKLPILQKIQLETSDNKGLQIESKEQLPIIPQIPNPSIKNDISHPIIQDSGVVSSSQKPSVKIEVVESSTSEIESNISKILKKHSSQKTRVYNSTVYKELESDYSIIVKTKNEEEDIFNILCKVAKNLGYKPTASTISFK